MLLMEIVEKFEQLDVDGFEMVGVKVVFEVGDQVPRIDSPPDHCLFFFINFA